MHFIDIVGVIGCLLILFAFYRTSIGRWTGKSLWYELDNFVGAACLVAYSINKHAYVNVALNVIWVLVAIKGLESIVDRRQAPKSKRRR